MIVVEDQQKLRSTTINSKSGQLQKERSVKTNFTCSPLLRTRKSLAGEERSEWRSWASSPLTCFEVSAIVCTEIEFENRQLRAHGDWSVYSFERAK